MLHSEESKILVLFLRFDNTQPSAPRSHWLSLICCCPCSLPEALLCFESFTCRQLKPCYQLGGRNPSKPGEGRGLPSPLCRAADERHDNVLRATSIHRPPVLWKGLQKLLWWNFIISDLYYFQFPHLSTGIINTTISWGWGENQMRLPT